MSYKLTKDIVKSSTTLAQCNGYTPSSIEVEVTHAQH